MMWQRGFWPIFFAAVIVVLVVIGFYASLFSGQPLAIAMLAWAFGASFALAAIGTRLALLPTSEEKPRRNSKSHLAPKRR
ncbi:hypothetical protein [Mesorhizobium sp. SP-1A]|uniref:hypothetical protein n=1 Tax=Mesorhizobium sp. SP-1A TaxID=3077840 RepID=UPI0028F72078|nr:hypothetical protein [Mesorhizobium sp. SP-1A]